MGQDPARLEINLLLLVKEQQYPLNAVGGTLSIAGSGSVPCSSWSGASRTFARGTDGDQHTAHRGRVGRGIRPQLEAHADQLASLKDTQSLSAAQRLSASAGFVRGVATGRGGRSGDGAVLGGCTWVWDWSLGCGVVIRKFRAGKRRRKMSSQCPP